jgi:hypothetical protein
MVVEHRRWRRASSVVQIDPALEIRLSEFAQLCVPSAATAWRPKAAQAIWRWLCRMAHGARGSSMRPRSRRRRLITIMRPTHAGRAGLTVLCLPDSAGHSASGPLAS